MVSYPTIPAKLEIPVNTAAKYVGLLEEHGLIVTERTDAITRDGLKHNGCLPYTIVPVPNAINAFNVWQLSALERAAARQQAQRQTEKSGVEFVPSVKNQSAWPLRCAACGARCTAMAV